MADPSLPSNAPAQFQRNIAHEGRVRLEDSRAGAAPGKEGNTAKLWRPFWDEYKAFCCALPGTELHGVTIRGDKPMTNGTATRTMVECFFLHHLTQRSPRSGPNKGRGRLEAKTLECALDALADLKAKQLLQTDLFKEMDDEEKSASVRTASVNSIIKNHGSTALARNLKDPHYDQSQIFHKIMGYTPETYLKLCQWGIWRAGSGEPARNKAYVATLCHLGNVISYSCITRSRDVREGGCAMLRLILAPDEGPMECFKLVYGATQKESDGKPLFCYMMPHKNVAQCGFWAIGLSLFTTYSVLKCTAPEFHDTASPDYYKFHQIFVGRVNSSRGKPGTIDPKVSANYDGIAGAVAKSQQTSGPGGTKVDVSGILHPSRRSSAQNNISKLSRASGSCAASETANAGRWGNLSHSFYESYVTDASPQSTRSLAGWSPLAGSFWLPRVGHLPSRVQYRPIGFGLGDALDLEESKQAGLRDPNLMVAGKAMEMCLQHFIAGVAVEYDNFRDRSFILGHEYFRSQVFLDYKEAQRLYIEENRNASLDQTLTTLRSRDNDPVAQAVVQMVNIWEHDRAPALGSSSSSRSPPSPSRRSTIVEAPSSPERRSSQIMPASPGTRDIIQAHRADSQAHISRLVSASVERNRGAASPLLSPVGPVAALSFSGLLGPSRKNELPPPAASSYDYASAVRQCRTVREVAEEYTRYSGILESLWGENNTLVAKGCSWRGSKCRGEQAQALNTLWSKFKPMYDLFDKCKDAATLEAEVGRLQALIDAEFSQGGPVNANRLAWLSRYLKEKRPGFEARSDKMKIARRSRIAGSSEVDISTAI